MSPLIKGVVEILGDSPCENISIMFFVIKTRTTGLIIYRW